MKASKRPFEARKRSHIGSKVDINVAAVRSMLRVLDVPGGMSCDRDAMGGGFDTFSPHPDKQPRQQPRHFV